MCVCVCVCVYDRKGQPKVFDLRQKLAFFLALLQIHVTQAVL